MGIFKSLSEAGKNMEDRELTHEKLVLRLARSRGGTLTIPEITLETSLSLDEAEDIMNILASKGYARMRIGSSGAILYEFPGIRPVTEPRKTVAVRGDSPASKTVKKMPEMKQGNSLSHDRFLKLNDADQTPVTSSPSLKAEKNKTGQSDDKTREIPDWIRKRRIRK